MTLALVALRCPTCATALPGTFGHVVYVCPKCPTAVEATRDGLVKLSAEFGEGAGAYAVWWRLDTAVTMTRFSATKPAKTPYGAVEQGRTLPAIFFVPAYENTIAACYDAALKTQALTMNPAPRRTDDKRPLSARLSQKSAELVARQVFLTHVARADGEVHYVELEIALKTASIFVAAATTTTA